MKIPLAKLNYSFKNKPLLVGGMAMEYYGLRKSDNDIDLIACEEDIINLIELYPNKVKDLWSDLGICPFEFEIWKSICYLTYDELKMGAVDEGEYLVITVEKLLLMKVLGIKKEKYLKDVQLIAQHLLDKQANKYEKVKSENSNILMRIKEVNYIEKSGPEK